MKPIKVTKLRGNHSTHFPGQVLRKVLKFIRYVLLKSTQIVSSSGEGSPTAQKQNCETTCRVDDQDRVGELWMVKKVDIK